MGNTDASIEIEVMPEQLATYKRWPIRPPLVDGELLTGWIARVAAAFGVAPAAFMRQVPYGQSDAIELDRDLLLDGIQRLARLSGQRPERIAEAMLVPPPGHLIRNDEANLHAFVSQQRRGLRKDGLGKTRVQFCPACLDEEAIFKKEWCLGFVAFCVVHELMLHDRCPRCAYPIRLLEQERALDQPGCSKCGFTFAAAERIKARKVYITVQYLLIELLNFLVNRSAPQEQLDLVLPWLFKLAAPSAEERLVAYRALNKGDEWATLISAQHGPTAFYWNQLVLEGYEIGKIPSKGRKYYRAKYHWALEAEKNLSKIKDGIKTRWSNRLWERQWVERYEKTRDPSLHAIFDMLSRF